MLNAALLLALAFAAERRAGAPRCGAAAAGACRRRSIFPARTALSSKPAARRGCGRMTGQTDGRTDGRSTVSQTLLNIHVQGG